ncbi:MAG: Asp23/Gls24 family envelope stress response protein [Anaerolineales bacterium]|nr:Asp23/Gls24 family envelope stress response protein [Chloroflexota bacterium]MBL6980725.1 Asp23/Gls24 family envelope stress response protein [Anaerolineales bacterium]
MTNEITQIGSIHVSPKAIATIAYQSALESYGVVGMASKNVVDGISSLLIKDPTHGVEVHFTGEHINIDMYIIIQYGTRIKSVAASVAKTVRFHVEKSMGVPLNEINVHVQGLRISDLDD